MGPDVKLNANVLTWCPLETQLPDLPVGLGREVGAGIGCPARPAAAGTGREAFGSVTCWTVTVASKSRPTSLVGVSKHAWHKLKHGVTDITRKMISERRVWQAEQILCGEEAAVTHARSSAKLGRCGE